MSTIANVADIVCDPLAATGAVFPVAALVLLAVGLLAGGLLLIATRKRRGRAVPLAVLLLVAMGLFGQGVAPSPAQAVGEDCSGPTDSLVITQTSTMAGLAPGMAPAEITGTVENISPDPVFVRAITVRIVSVDSATGDCDASDFVLDDVQMPVGLTIDPGGTANFSGGSLGFLDKASNQNGCKSATIHLQYTAEP